MTARLSLKTRLSTPLLAETCDWYRDLFGLELLEEWDEPGDRGCILGFPGGVSQALLEIHHCKTGSNFAGLSLQFRVDDINAFALPKDQRFASRGPEDRPWGSRYLFLTDPNGVSVVVFSGASL